MLKFFALCGECPKALSLACRHPKGTCFTAFGRRFCFAEVSTGHPHPLESASFVLSSLDTTFSCDR